jgi:hypothetical protein
MRKDKKEDYDSPKKPLRTESPVDLTNKTMRPAILLLGAAAVTSLVITTLLVGIYSITRAKNGIDCWDQNANGICDPFEDIFHDGFCNYRDCSSARSNIDGTNGTIGADCWDLNGNKLCDPIEDKNSDFVCNATDCQIAVKCLDCWDLNSNYLCDLPEEDTTFDGKCDQSDCVGPAGTDGCSCYQCYDLNQNGFCDLATEDLDNSGVCDELDCRGINGTNCWDLNNNSLCDLLTEDRNNDTVCNVSDCTGATGPIGFACWDFIGKNRECDALYEDTNGDGVCDELDCLPINCWDLNENRLCDPASEDLTGDGNCTAADCNPNQLGFASAAVPNSIVIRDPNGSFAMNSLEVVNLRVSTGVIGETGANVTTYALAVGTVTSASGNLTITTPNPVVNDVIINDDLVVTGTVFTDSIMARSADLIITADNVIINGTARLQSISNYQGNELSFNTNMTVFGIVRANAITNSFGSNLTLISTTGVTEFFGNIHMNAGTFYTNAIESAVSLSFLCPVSMGTVSTERIVAPSNTMTFIANSVIFNGTVRVDSISSLAQSSVLFPKGIDTTLVTSSSVLLLSSSTGNVSVNGTLRVDQLTSLTNNTDLTLSGLGSGNVSVSSVLKVATVTEKTGGASVTFTNGVKLDGNGVSGYTASKLDYAEQLNQTGIIFSALDTNVSVSFAFFRLGSKVWISLRSGIGGTMISTANMTINSSVTPASALQIPTRMRPGNSVALPFYCLAPTQQTTCVLHVSSSTGGLVITNGGVPFTSGMSVTIFEFTKDYTVAA